MAIPPLPPLPAAPEPAAPTAIQPAAQAKPPAAITFPSVSPTTVAQFQAFETMVGGRAALCAKLALVARGKEEERIVGLLADPQHDAVSLAAVCRFGKIPLRQLMELYRDAALVVGQVQAIDQVASGLPAVAADVMARAVEHYVDCAGCTGTGSVTPEPTKDKPNPAPEPCKVCRGIGQLKQAPEHEIQKTALTLGGMLKKDGGTSITLQQNNQQIVGMGAAGGFDDLIEKLDTVLFGAARDRVARREQTVVDADLVAPGDVTDDGAEAAPSA